MERIKKKIKRGKERIFNILNILSLPLFLFFFKNEPKKYVYNFQQFKY